MLHCIYILINSIVFIYSIVHWKIFFRECVLKLNIDIWWKSTPIYKQKWLIDSKFWVSTYPHPHNKGEYVTLSAQISSANQFERSFNIPTPRNTRAYVLYSWQHAITFTDWHTNVREAAWQCIDNTRLYLFASQMKTCALKH